MLSRRPRSRAIPGRGIWAGLALTPILIALVALAASAFGGAAATAGPKANVSLAAAKARARPTMTRTEAATAVAKYWTRARVAKATDILTGRHVPKAAPDVVPGPPHTSFNWYPGFPRKPQHRSVLIYYTQGGTEHVCSGGVMGWDNPNTAAVEGPQNMVWTAGRCVHRGDNLESGWSDNVMVCPVHVSTGPFNAGGVNEGCWVWESESTTPEWYTDNWESRDYGVVFTSTTRITAPCSATTCTVVTGGPNVAAYPPGNPKGTYTLCDESTAAGHTPDTQCAYNLPRAQAWWAVGYHNPNTLQPASATNTFGGSTDIRLRNCTTTGAAAPPRECFPLTVRVEQMQFANTHAALASNPAGGAADTGPLVNTVGDYQQVAVDSARLAAGSCVEQYEGTNNTAPAQTAPCTGSFTGAPWLVSSGLNNHGWNGNEARFGSVRINSNASYADAGEDDLPNTATGVYGGSMQGPYFDTITCFDYQAWSLWTGAC